MKFHGARMNFTKREISPLKISRKISRNFTQTKSTRCASVVSEVIVFGLHLAYWALRNYTGQETGNESADVVEKLTKWQMSPKKRNSRTSFNHTPNVFYGPLLKPLPRGKVPDSLLGDNEPFYKETDHIRRPDRITDPGPRPGLK